MPRFYFHLKHGQVTVLDQEGIDLADSTQAKERAVRLAQDILAREGPAVGRRIIITDDDWQQLYELPF
jgi:hypothetical protein